MAAEREFVIFSESGEGWLKRVYIGDVSVANIEAAVGEWRRAPFRQRQSARTSAGSMRLPR